MEAPVEPASRPVQIVTLTVNPALDITTRVDVVRPTDKLRCETTRYDPGGGGVNVARIAHVLGASVSAVFPAGGATGDVVMSLLNDAGVPFQQVAINGATRESFTVNEASTGRAVKSTAICRLLDGRQILLRRLEIDDAEAVAALHQRLSDHDRYFRFFTLNPTHLDELVSKLVEPSDGEYALGAFDGDRLIGVANYAVSADPTVADVAILVAHEDHSHGVGTTLLKRLAQIARGHEIRRFVADVLAVNHLMLEVFSDLGWPRERMNYGSVLHLDLDLPDRITEASKASDEIPHEGVPNVGDRKKTRNTGLRRRIGSI